MTIAIDQATTYQTVEGFGVNVGYGVKTASSNLYAMAEMTDAEADHFFVDLGFSIARYGSMDTDGTPISPNNARKATDRGVRLFVLPMIAGGKMGPDSWYPSGVFDNANNAAAAAMVVAFVEALRSYGAPVSLVEICNEPDGSWSAWGTSATKVTSFAGALGPALQSAGLPKLLGPSVTNKATLSTFGDPLLNDAMIMPLLGAVSVHGYGGTINPYALAASNGKNLWMSEWCENAGSSFTASMADGITVARRIHDDLVTGGVTAWCWHLYKADTGEYPAGIGNIGLWGSSGEHTKREYTAGHFAKFVRPGYVRISCTAAPAGVYATAYLNTATPARVVVLINSNASTQPVTFSGLGSGSSANVWLTDAVHDLAQQPSITVSGGTASYTMPASSVVTLTVISAPSVLPATLNATNTSYTTAAPSGSALVFDPGERAEWPVDLGGLSGLSGSGSITASHWGRARLLVDGFEKASWFYHGDLDEEEVDVMPAGTTSGAATVSCSSTAWTRLDPSPLANRSRILVMNPDTTNFLGILFTGDDSVPTAGTAPAYVVGPSYDALLAPIGSLTGTVRVWGKSITGTVAAAVTQFGT